MLKRFSFFVCPEYKSVYVKVAKCFKTQGFPEVIVYVSYAQWTWLKHTYITWPL